MGGRGSKIALAESAPTEDDEILDHFETEVAGRFGTSSEVFRYSSPSARSIRITSIMAYDHWGHGRADVVGGGVGQKNVDVKLESPYLYGYKFSVIVTGREVNPSV